MNSYRLKVLFLKIFLLSFSMTMVGYVVLKVQSNQESKNVKIEKEESKFENNKIENHPKNHTLVENSELSIEKLNFMSKTNDDKAYNVIANSAEKSELGIYNMRIISANIALSEGLLSLTALEGKYDESNNLLKLTREILGSYNGYKFTTNSVELDLKTKDMQGSEQISLESDDLNLIADKFYTKGENIIGFEGNVKTHIYISK